MTSQTAEVIEKSASPERQICRNCKHEKVEHQRVVNVINMCFDFKDCKHSIIFKDVEYKCTCKQFVS